MTDRDAGSLGSRRRRLYSTHAGRRLSPALDLSIVWWILVDLLTPHVAPLGTLFERDNSSLKSETLLQWIKCYTHFVYVVRDISVLPIDGEGFAGLHGLVFNLAAQALQAPGLGHGHEPWFLDTRDTRFGASFRKFFVYIEIRVDKNSKHISIILSSSKQVYETLFVVRAWVTSLSLFCSAPRDC